MRVFMEEPTGTFEEILDFEITKIAKIEDRVLRETLSEILKLSLHTEEGFEYVALIKPDGWVEVRYLQDKKSSDPFHHGDKQEIGRNIGLFMTSFWGNMVKADEVRQWITDYVFNTWTEFAESAVKEISNMHRCFRS